MWPLARHIGHAFQHYALIPHLTVLQNVAIPCVDPRVGTGRWTCWATWGWLTWPTSTRPAFRAASSSASVIARLLGGDSRVLRPRTLLALDVAARGRLQGELLARSTNWACPPYM